MKIKIDCAYDELIQIEKLVPHKDNNNIHPSEQIETLAKIIKAHGFRSAVVVSKRSGFVVQGHGRIEALKLLGESHCPVDYQDYESEAEEFQCLVADNEIARTSILDYAKLNESLKNIPEIKIELMGIANFSIPEIKIENNSSKKTEKSFEFEEDDSSDSEIINEEKSRRQIEDEISNAPDEFHKKNKEIETENYGAQLKHMCPSCGFEFGE